MNRCAGAMRRARNTRAIYGLEFLSSVPWGVYRQHPSAAKLLHPQQMLQHAIRATDKMGCGASTSNPPLSATKMRLIAEMPEEKRRVCEQVGQPDN